MAPSTWPTSQSEGGPCPLLSAWIPSQRMLTPRPSPGCGRGGSSAVWVTKALPEQEDEHRQFCTFPGHAAAMQVCAPFSLSPPPFPPRPFHTRLAGSARSGGDPPHTGGFRRPSSSWPTTASCWWLGNSPHPYPHACTPPSTCVCAEDYFFRGIAMAGQGQLLVGACVCVCVGGILPAIRWPADLARSDGRVAATGDSQGFLHVIDTLEMKPVKKLAAHTAAITALASPREPSAAGEYPVLGDSRRTPLRVWKPYGRLGGAVGRGW